MAEDLADLERVEIDDLGELEFVLPAGEFRQDVGLRIDQGQVVVVDPEQAAYLFRAQADAFDLFIGNVEIAQDLVVAHLADEGQALAVRRQGDMVDQRRTSEDLKRRRIAERRGRLGGRGGCVLALCILARGLLCPGALTQYGHGGNAATQGQQAPAIDDFHNNPPRRPAATIFADGIGARGLHVPREVFQVNWLRNQVVWRLA